MKVCGMCHIEKEDSAFQIRRYENRERLQGYCKQCNKVYAELGRRKKGVPVRQRSSISELRNSKVCTRCLIEKGKDGYRVRVKTKNGIDYFYWSPHCRECERKISAERYERLKNDPEFKKQNVARVKRYRDSNIEEINKRRKLPGYQKKHREWNNKIYHRTKEFVAAKMKAKRQTDEYKRKMRDYRNRNKEKIFHQEVVTKQRYHVKNRDGITDRYVTNLLLSQGLAVTPEIIEAKRLQILIQRKIKNHVN